MTTTSSICGSSSVLYNYMNKKHVLADWGFVCAVAAVFIACSCLLVQSCPELRPLCTHQAQLKAEWMLLNTQDALYSFFLTSRLSFDSLFLHIFSFFFIHSAQKHLLPRHSFPLSDFSYLCLSLSVSSIKKTHLTWLMDTDRGFTEVKVRLGGVNLSASVYIPLLTSLGYNQKVVKLLILHCSIYLCSGLWFGIWPLEHIWTGSSISRLNNSDA